MVNPGVGEVNCDPLLIPEWVTGVGEARVLLAGEDVLLIANGVIAGAGDERLRGAGLDVLEFGLI